MKKEQIKQNERGITLVALIITIIILIILAAVTIKTLTHDGLLDMAIKGAQDYKVAEQKELGEMNKLSDNLNSIISGIGSEGGGKEPVVIEGVITFGSLSWSNQKASVTVNKTTSDSLSIEYQVLNKDNQVIVSYTPITNGGTVSNLNLGDFVIARLTDGQNHGNSASLEVTDGTLPTAPTFGTPSGEKKNNSGWYTGNVTVLINPGTDAESGVLKTTYSITGAGAKSETEGTSVTISIEGTSTIIAYTYDNAGHKTASTPLEIKLDKTNPPAVNLTFSEKTGNTVKVTTSMSSTSDISGIAKYIFEYKKSTETDTAWKTAKEETTRPSTYTYSGLDSNTEYNFRVRTVDNAGRENAGTKVTGTTENKWSNSSVEEVKVKDENGNDVSIPKPTDSTILNPDATVDQGIVMKDSKDNEWVWVPVDEATYNSMFAENTNGIALAGSTGVKATKYSKGGIISGWQRGAPGSTENREPDIVTEYDRDSYAQTAGFTNLNDMAIKMVSEYNTMLHSIQKYGGFYIGRYELSSSGVKANQTPTKNANWYTLYKRCKELTIEESKGISRMIWRMPMGCYL